MATSRYLLPLLLLLLLGLAALMLRPDQEDDGQAPAAGASGVERSGQARSGKSTGDHLPSKSRDRRPRSKLRTTASGLQYEVLREGSGDSPGPTDRVAVHYEGRLPDGTVFDSSYERDPMEFTLNQVIAGWQEGLQLMSPGAKFRLIIPSELAYGEHGAGEMIPPNTALTFEIELITFLSVEVTESRIEEPVFSPAKLEFTPESGDLPACR